MSSQPYAPQITQGRARLSDILRRCFCKCILKGLGHREPSRLVPNVIIGTITTVTQPNAMKIGEARDLVQKSVLDVCTRKSCNQKPAWVIFSTMTQNEMLEYQAQGFQAAVTAELSCKQCGDFRLLLPENYKGQQIRCPVCATPCQVYPLGGLCLTKRQLPAFDQVRVASYLRPSSLAELNDLRGN